MTVVVISSIGGYTSRFRGAHKVVHMMTIGRMGWIGSCLLEPNAAGDALRREYMSYIRRENGHLLC